MQTSGACLLAALGVALVALGPDYGIAQGPKSSGLPIDLALVPTNAVGFVHVRGGELWKNDAFSGLRATFERAGPKAITALDQQFIPKPSTFDRLTVFALPGERVGEPVPYAILSFSSPFEIADVVFSYLPKATAEKINGKTVYRGDDMPFELFFPDRQHMVLSMSGEMAKYLKQDLSKSGPLSKSLALAAKGKVVVAGLNIGALPIRPGDLAFLPPEVQVLTKAESITASLDLKKEATFSLSATYKNAAEAQDAETAVKKLAELGRTELGRVKEELEKKLFDPKIKTPRSPVELPETLFSVFALGAIAQADEWLANPGQYVKRDGTELSAQVTLPKELVTNGATLAATGVGLLLPAVQKVRMSAGRAQSSNNLKQIALAVHTYHDVYDHFPQDITDKNGKPLLSWRVAILPFIEQQQLYMQFKLDEPWDSEHNKKWSQIAVKVFMSPTAVPPTPPGMTHYKAFVGPGTVFEPGKPIKFADVTDGLSNTILAMESGEAIPWAKPGDIPYDPKKPLPKLNLQGVPSIVLVAMCDGSVRAVDVSKVSEQTLRNAITRNDGNPLGKDW
jgi:hypothetical protein